MLTEPRRSVFMQMTNAGSAALLSRGGHLEVMTLRDC
jgi:hypothetical protein